MSTKAQLIRRLLAEGKSKSQVAREAGTSYQYVHHVWTSLSKIQQGNALRQKPAKPFTQGLRVIHRGQVDPSLYYVVLESNGFKTKLKLGYHVPPHLKRFQKIPIVIPTRDLIRAPGGRRVTSS